MTLELLRAEEPKPGEGGWSDRGGDLPAGAVGEFLAAHCWESNIAPDTTPEASPERRLLVAILAQAIQDRDVDGPAFEGLCGLLDLDPVRLRAGARAKRRRNLTGLFAVQRMMGV